MPELSSGKLSGCDECLSTDGSISCTSYGHNVPAVEMVCWFHVHLRY